MAKAFGYDAGTAAGLVAGALTESATIGTAMDAIARLDLSEAERTALSNNIPVAFAVTYLVGVTVAAWVLSQLAPKLMRVDLAEECRKLEEQMQGGGAVQVSARREQELRAYAVDPGSRFVGRASPTWRRPGRARGSSSSRCDSRGQIVASRDVKALQAGDVVAVSGRRTTLVEVLEAPGSGLREVDDRELLDVPGEVVDVVVTNKAIDGRTLADLARDEISRGVFLRRITRAGTTLGVLPDTKVHRGDVLTIAGSAASTARVAEAFGIADRATDVTDMMVVATGIVAGALIGLPALHVGGVEIGLSLPVGVLLGGLVCGWLRSVRPGMFGRVPGPTLWIFESIGLTGIRGGGWPECRARFRAGPEGERTEPRRGWSDHHHGVAAHRGNARQVAVQDASRRAARRGRRRLHGHARRWLQCRRPRAVPCLRSVTAWPTPWATYCWPSGAR